MLPSLVLQPVPWKMRLEMVKEMQMEILNGKEILVNCEVKLNIEILIGFEF